MKTPIVFQLAIVLLLIAASGNITAQDFKGGTVKYQLITRYDFSGRDDPRWKDFVANLPKETKHMKALYFTNEKALYEDDPAQSEAQPPGLRRALHFMSRGKPPKPELTKVFYDFGKKELINQLHFMTRDFIVFDQIKKTAWKLNNKKIKIQDHICFGAELIMDGDTVIAWFSPNIPISAGPDKYYGLPGLILAVEINGETKYLAISIDLTPPIDEKLSIPEDGSEVTKEEFDEIIKEKIQEFKETKRHGHGRDGKGRRGRR